MSRIAGRFEALAAQGRKALVTYVVAGDPTQDITVPLLHSLVANGADILELGVPFSDPMSEGPTIQLGHERALASGTSLRRILGLVEAFRREDSETPLLLMGYANPIEHMGFAAFADAASEAGVDALLTVDIPPEEVAAINQELKRVGMDNIFLIAPTTPEARMDLIAEQASGFIYYVSVKGVTGAGHLDVGDAATHVTAIRQHSSLPIAVGFGIKDAESARAVAETADGVVVGSALVQRVADVIDAGEGNEAAIGAAGALVREIRLGIDRVAS